MVTSLSKKAKVNIGAFQPSWTEEAKVFMEALRSIRKIFAVTTDGAAMVRKQRGAVKLTEEKVSHSIMKRHCVIHQENLCAKMSNSGTGQGLR